MFQTDSKLASNSGQSPCESTNSSTAILNNSELLLAP